MVLFMQYIMLWPISNWPKYCIVSRPRLVCGLDIKGVGQRRPQTDNMICAVDPDLSVGKEADVRIQTWHFHKTDPAGSFTFVVESIAMSEGLAEAERVTSWIFTAKVGFFIKCLN